jgi:hypothetical protein
MNNKYPYHWALAAAVSIGYGIAAMHGQTPVKNPSSDVEFAHDSNAALISSLKLRPPSTDSFEVQIAKTMSDLNRASGLNTSLWICHGCGTSSHPTLGVIVDIDQVNQIKTKAQVEQVAAILIFLLGHEQAHQLQYHAYSNSIVERSELDRQVYEAQADILGGKFLIELLPEASLASIGKDAIPETLHVAYNLGVEQYAIADHPSQDGRLTAARYGMAAGTMTKLRQLGGQPALGSADTIAKKIDYHQGDDAMSWSWRASRRIVNYRRPEIVDLVLLDKTVNWNKNAATPYVSYQVTYENRGKHSLDINVEVQCISVPRADRDDYFHWEKIDANKFAFTLKPAEKKTLSGSMQWAASQDLMPRVIASPDPTGLIEVVDPTASVTLASLAPAKGGLNEATTAGSRADIRYWVGQVIGSSASDFVSLRSGPGEKDGDNIVYPIDPQFPGSQSSKVWLPDTGVKSDPYVYVVVDRSRDEASAQDIYNTTTSNIRSQLQKIGHWEENIKSATANSPASDRFSQGNLEVAVSDRLSDGVYRVVVSVTVHKS